MTWRSSIGILLLALVWTSVAEAEGCRIVETCDVNTCTYETVCDPPPTIYYTIMYERPDWCIYRSYDEVDITYDPTTGQPQTWYVTPEADPGRDGDYVVIRDQRGDCYLLQYPW